MKTRHFLFALPIVIGIIALTACNNHTEQLQKLMGIVKTDSVMLVQSKQKDSSITSYLADLNNIQYLLDTIKLKEKIINSNMPEYKAGTRESIIEDIKQIDNLLLRNNQRINNLEVGMRRMKIKNDTLESIIAHFEQEITEKVEEIATLQAELNIKNDSLRDLNHRFNDSMMVIYKARTSVQRLKFQLYTVHYVAGTMKELLDKHIVTREGGLLGIGKTLKIAPGVKDSLFTSVYFNTLNSFPLAGKFKQIVTSHPLNSYNITPGVNSDVLVITSPQNFWGTSKYCVVVTADLKK